MGGPRLPLDPPPRDGQTGYQQRRRWLFRHRGPVVRTLDDLRWALHQPEWFYIIPEKFR